MFFTLSLTSRYYGSTYLIERKKIMEIPKVAVGLIIGFVIGKAVENIRYSIIAHEAEKGDERCKQIMNEFPMVGEWLEKVLSK